MTVGICVIENNINHKKYVGQSKNIEERWQQHKAPYEHRRYANKPLYKAFNQYGLDNFNFYILEECAIQDLNEKEIYWIEKMDTYKNGYNATLGGDGYRCGGGENSPGNKISQQIATDIQEMLLQGASSKEIQKKYPIVTDGIVSSINQGHTWVNTTLKYPLKKRHGPHLWTDEEALQIKQEYSNGSSIIELSKKYHVNRDRISELVRGKTYTHLPIIKRKVNYIYNNYSQRKLSQEEVLNARAEVYINNKSIWSVWEQSYKEKIKYPAFRNMIRGITYKSVGGVPQNEL